MLYRMMAAGCTAVLCTLTSSASAQVDSLDEALALAYSENDTLNIDRLGLEAIETELGIARTGYRPTLLAEGSVQRTEIDIENTGYSGGLRLNQPIYRGGQTRAAVRAAKSNIDAGEASLRSTENQIFRLVTLAYADILLNREVRRIYRDLESGLRRQRDAERRRLEAGERTRTDIAQSEARLSDAIAGAARAQAELQVARQEFRRLVGAEPSDPLAPIDLPVQPPTSLDQALKLARIHNPLIEQLRHSADVADAQVDIRRGAMLPTLALEARLQYRDQVFEFTGVEIEQTLGTVGATLQVPLYQAGGARAQLRRAKRVRKLRQFEVTEAMRDVESAVLAAWEAYEALSFELTATRQSVEANQAAVDGVRTEASFGTRSTIEVLDAERELQNAQIRYAQTRRDILVATVDLLAAVGLFTADDLGLEQKVEERG